MAGVNRPPEKDDPSSLALVDKIVSDYNLDSGSAIVILQQVQAKYGHVSPSMLERISQLTNISTSVLFSIVTFYSQFRLDPIGENLIQVCHGTACHLAGAEKISEAVQLESKAKSGQTSEDGKFTVEKVACLGCCSLGPVMNINDETHVRLTPEEARKLINGYREGCHCGGHKQADNDSTEGVTKSD